MDMEPVPELQFQGNIEGGQVFEFSKRILETMVNLVEIG